MRITIRLEEPWASWLRWLAKNEGHKPTGWVRRHIKVAAQCQRLPGAVAPAYVRRKRWKP